MRSPLCIVIALLLSFAAAASAQRLQTPQASQKATVVQRIGLTEIAITYSRPPVKGRPIFGDAPADMAKRAVGDKTLDNQNERKAGEPIVPFGHVWRAGANEATIFAINDDVLINGQPLAAGSYSLHTLPTKDEWTIIFNKDDGQWGSFDYDASKDVLRVKVKPEWLTDSQELLTYMIDPALSTDTPPTATATATVNIRWEKVRVPFTVEVKDMNAKALAHVRVAVASAQSDNSVIPFSAGNWATRNKFADDATKFFERALSGVNEQIKAKETFGALRQKATILFNLKRPDESLAAAERAIVVGKADPAIKAEDIAALEKAIADRKAGKQ